MSDQNFTDFPLLTSTPMSGDYLVGYKADGSDEFRSQVQNFKFVKSDSTLTPGATAVNNIVKITLNKYLNLIDKDPNTLYFIVDGDY